MKSAKEKMVVFACLAVILAPDSFFRA